MIPVISGLHHVTFVVTDLEQGITWFHRVLGARHQERFDHHDEDGERFGVILALEGFPAMIELRVATPNYELTPGYDPVTFEVPDSNALDAWLQHLEDNGVSHSPVKRRRTGRSIEFFTPDGMLLRLFTAPEGGFEKVRFQESVVDH